MKKLTSARKTASYLKSYNGVGNRRFLECYIGNHKLGNDILVLNMGSATDCPSKAMGMCTLCQGDKDDCYALIEEIRYPAVKPYRDRQQDYWLSHTGEEISWDIIHLLLTKTTKTTMGESRSVIETIRWFRFNEAGDFWSQACVEKLDIISKRLMAYGIKTYGYTARADLDFSGVSFCCKGSGHENGNNGVTIVRKARDIEANYKGNTYTEDGTKYKICVGNCRKCAYCKKFNGLNVVFALHGKKQKAFTRKSK